MKTAEAKTSKPIVLLVSALATFSASILATAVSVALPSIGVEFAMEAQLLGWVVTVFVLAAAVVMVPIGRIADIYGRTRVFSFGMLAFIVSSVLCAASPSAGFLILFRVLQGISAAMIWGPSIAMLTSAFSIEERGRAIGINTAAVYCGLTVGPFWGGILTEHLGWRSVFYITVIVVVLAAALAFWKLRGEERMESRGEGFDSGGAFIWMAAVFLIIYGFASLPGALSAVLIAVGMAGLVAFYFVETRAANPVLAIGLFRHNPTFVYTLAAVLVQYISTFAPSFLMSLYLQYNKGFSPQTAGAILVVQPALMVALAPLAGRLSDRVEPLKVSSYGMGLICISLILFALLNDGSSLWLILAALALFGMGAGFFASPTTNAVMSSVERRYLGVAAGAVATMRHTGQVLSMGIVMILFAVYVGRTQITPEHYAAFLKSFQASFIIFAVLCLGGIIIMQIARRFGAKARWAADGSGTP